MPKASYRFYGAACAAIFLAGTTWADVVQAQETAVPLVSTEPGAQQVIEAPQFTVPDLSAPTLTDAGTVVPTVPVATPAATSEIASSVDAAPIAGAITTPVVLPETVPEAAPVSMAHQATQSALKFLQDGGPSIWAIAALSVLTMALILWKLWRYLLLGAWGHGRAFRAVDLFEAGDMQAAQGLVQGRRALRSHMVATAMGARVNRSDTDAREETARVAKQRLAEAVTGLRALELIATIAPLLGLLGTVMGMIAAFQALQESGSRADPSMLAGGIWEALLTTAAGMAVAIPASAALTWFEAIVDRLRRDSEDLCARIFLAPLPAMSPLSPRAEVTEPTSPLRAPAQSAMPLAAE